MARKLVKLSTLQLDALSQYLGALRGAGRPKGIRWQTRRSLVRLDLLDSFGTLTEAGYDIARSVRDDDVISVEVRRPR